MTWQMLLIGAYRVAGALPVLRWPFAGALVALLTDFGDLFLMDWLGGIADYQRFDKVCDLAYMATFAIVALRWRPLERNVALGLLALRLAGDGLFELTGSRAVLFAFPNLFEFWFIFVAARDRFRPTLMIDRRAAMVALPLLLAAKESQEWFLHVDRFLDSYVATDVVADLWHGLTGR
ncbi:MAG TPA: hypothetical protein VIN74_00520 [Candidatus Limnocylindria bacterium]